MEKEVKIESAYWPEGMVIPVVSRIHAVIRKHKLSLQSEHLIYRRMRETDIKDFVSLEEEWFKVPCTYDTYKESLADENTIIIGCYWKPPDDDEEYPLGNIVLSRTTDRLSLSYFSQDGTIDFNCKDDNENPIFPLYETTRCLAYICSVGVIDEARRLGVGSKLIQLGGEDARKQWTNCVGITLHVLANNPKAVAFYVKNNFTELFVVDDCYYINEAYCQAKYFAKAFSNLPPRLHRPATLGEINERLSAFGNRLANTLLNILF